MTHFHLYKKSAVFLSIESWIFEELKRKTRIEKGIRYLLMRAYSLTVDIHQLVCS